MIEHENVELYFSYGSCFEVYDAEYVASRGAA